MPSSAHLWGNEGWVLDAARQAAVLAGAKTTALNAIDQYHAETVQRLFGNPTQVEKDSWALKLETANTIIAKTRMKSTGQAFLAASGMADGVAQSDWATSVLVKASTYATVVGIAERLRTSAKAAVREAEGEKALQTALAVQRAAADTVAAQFMREAEQAR